MLSIVIMSQQQHDLVLGEKSKFKKLYTPSRIYVNPSLKTFFVENANVVSQLIKGKLHIVDTTCTHIGCEVESNSGERTWDCPCHDSKFSNTGDVIEGPAEKPLQNMFIR